MFAAGCMASAGWDLCATPLGIPIGSQVYPHRQRIKDGDFAGLLRDLKNLGVGYPGRGSKRADALLI